MVRLTKSGLVFLMLTGLLYLSSMQSQSGLLFFIIGILFACYMLNLYFALRSLKYIKIDIPYSVRMMEDETSRIAIRIENHSESPQGMIEIRSSYGRIMKIGVLSPRQEVYISPEITFPVRGVYPFSKFKVFSSFPFGLVNISKNIQETGEFVVLPQVYPFPSPPAGGFEPMFGGGFFGRNKSVSGSDFAGVRPFTSDDSYKYIHWKSSSKGAGLMVKEFSEELSGRIFVIMQRTVITDNKDDENILDTAVRAAGSIAMSALDIGHHVDFVGLGSEEITRLSPFSDTMAFLEILARIEKTKISPSYEILKKAVEQAPRRAAICFVITSYVKPLEQLVKELNNEGRKISVLLPDELNAKYAFPPEIEEVIYKIERNRG